MYTMIRRNPRLILLVLCMLGIGFVSGEYWKLRFPITIVDDYLNFQKDESGEIQRPSWSFNNILEHQSDSDGDGKMDSWAVQMEWDESGLASYRYWDRDGDGFSDSAKVSWADASAYILRDENRRGVPSDQSIKLYPLPQAETAQAETAIGYLYYDIDLNGKLDMMVTVSRSSESGREKVIDNLVRMGNRWVSVLEAEGGDWTEGFWVSDLPEQKMHVIFDRASGDWILDDGTSSSIQYTP